MVSGAGPLKPNAKEEYDQRPDYIRELIGSTGLNSEAVGVILGVDRRTVNRWQSGQRQFPYTAQFALEALVLSPEL